MGFPPITDDPVDEFSAATVAFQKELSSIIGDTQVERRILELYNAYTSELLTAAPSPANANMAQERYMAYAGAVADAFSGSGPKAGLKAAFVTYQRALQEAWATLGSNALGFEKFMVLTQEMQWVASVLGTVRSISAKAHD